MGMHCACIKWWGLLRIDNELIIRLQNKQGEQKVKPLFSHFAYLFVSWFHIFYLFLCIIPFFVNVLLNFLIVILFIFVSFIFFIFCLSKRSYVLKWMYSIVVCMCSTLPPPLRVRALALMKNSAVVEEEKPT